MNQTAATTFRFSTKAANLAQLANRLRHGTILEQDVPLVSDWRSDREGCLTRIAKRFDSGPVIVRSSAQGEDSVDASMAGAFKSVAGIPSGDRDALAAAFDEVIASYAHKHRQAIDHYEVLVQPMVSPVRASGVVFTRDLEKCGPYYVLNYDDQSDRTDTITGGTAGAHKILRVFRDIDTRTLDPFARTVIEAARELEAVTDCDALDIEFAVDGNGRLYVLQVRPLARTQILSYQSLDARVASEIRHAREFVKAKLSRRPHLYGATTVLGEMPDWNPAEMIGNRPKPLAMSLYRYIILKSVWREARQLVGYNHPYPYHLLVEVAGRPYIDVRCSFNSFLPAALPAELCEKLVDYYVAELQKHPEFHDKIEFEIVISCLAFDFERHAGRLRSSGFTESDVQVLRNGLHALTDDLVNDRGGVLRGLEADVERLGPRRQAILAASHAPGNAMMTVEQLLEDCIRFGTLPFSVFARCAFVATSFLRSLVDRGVWTAEEYGHYVRSISTVAGEFVHDLDRCKAGSLDVATFLARYGHLRPGTYDISAPTYSERPDLYLGIGSAAGSVTAPGPVDVPQGGDFPAHLRPQIQALIDEYGFTFDLDTLNRFVVRSIQLRESVKFEFTKNLSAALTTIAQFGRYHGLTRDALSFLRIERFLELANGNPSDEWLSAARDEIDRHRKQYESRGAINLPDLIYSAGDLEMVSLQDRRPNFITHKRVVGPSCHLAADSLDHVRDLAGCVVLIDNADPGYDWLFGKKIGGLVTKYGGAASHMTIRCAEFGLPAAIGCGEQIFSRLARAQSIFLDCAERVVRPNSA